MFLVDMSLLFIIEQLVNFNLRSVKENRDKFTRSGCAIAN